MPLNYGELCLAKDVELGEIEVDSDANYVAIRSGIPYSIPDISWTVFKVSKRISGPFLRINKQEPDFKNIKSMINLIWVPVSPPKLTKMVLTTQPGHLQHLDQSSIFSNLPVLLKTGQFIPKLNCQVLACEPAEQGIVPSEQEDLTVSVFEVPDVSDKNTHRSDVVSPNNFISDETEYLEVSVKPFSQPISLSSLLPPVSTHHDPEHIACINITSLVKLGCFSGDLVQVLTDGDPKNAKSQYIRLYSYPEPSDIPEDVLYMAPMKAYNLGSPEHLLIRKVETSESDLFDLAREVSLSRISSSVSSDKANQVASLRGLRTYFAQCASRIVTNGDVIAVPIDTKLARIVGITTAGNDENHQHSVDINILHDMSSSPDQVVWFQVNGLPDSTKQYMISATHTRMVQSGVIQLSAPPTTLPWRSYLGLHEHFDYLSDTKSFSYAHKLRKLLQASQLRRKNPLRSTILLKSSKRGAGKGTVLSSVAASLGIHEFVLDAHELLGDSDAKTLGLLQARLERASSTAQCLVTIRHLEAIGKKHDSDGKDTNLVNGFIDILDQFLSADDNSISLAVTVSDPDLLTASIRNKFKFEVDVSVPTERERSAIFQYLLSSDSSNGKPNTVLVSRLPPEVFEGYVLRKDVTYSSLAIKSAGLTPSDLKSLVTSAEQTAYRETTQNLVLCNRGLIQLTPKIIEMAINNARSKFSDSIGAPKIPNVGWKDVGGLDMVKGEILDTIDMPLKHPELFASGLKKRSGILFYGPPGTGKTLLAKAIASNFSLNFFSVKGPELLNMYIGESEANVRRVFQKARDAKPCVIFFDELDSVAPKRGNKGDSGGVMDRIVSQLLAELDGMSDGGDGVFVVGATNRPDLLDEALLRPGRFDKMLYLGISDTHEKQQTILEALTRKFALAKDVDLHEVASLCPFTYTGADFYAMCSDAMLNAMTRTAGEVDAKITEYNTAHPREPISIRRWFESVATEDDIKVQVSKQDFNKAQKELIPSVSAEELQHYLRVRNTFEGAA